MKLANVNGEMSIVMNRQHFPIAELSGGRFGPSPEDIYRRWSDFSHWAGGVELAEGLPLSATELGAPSPRPRQVFAVALNYSDHVKESGLSDPALPLFFTKFPSSVAGPYGELPLPSDRVDWEAELVVVIGRHARNIGEREAWDYVAGVTVGQDYSERLLQLYGPAPQFGLAKSYPGFSPIGPWLVTPDELDDRDNLPLTCEIDGTVVQSADTSLMIFSVAQQIAFLTQITDLYPGDVIFTGTPNGVGHGMKPPRYIRDGETITTTIVGVGRICQTARTAERPTFTDVLVAGGR
ncbi:fumarylacetoacetate hydrolase family protein [Mycobacteroides abscessus]|uniref:fumarylacetoacetate hydrolase family protein n=1 Tax=Mycobacteroides abscessus TaxID=36809 RepID=UPI0003096D6B|nr:fumarylacetoacetate hydrolase family protein [Mycobacteroides abscessus]